jgi:hypothetical protein
VEVAPTGARCPNTSTTPATFARFTHASLIHDHDIYSQRPTNTNAQFCRAVIRKTYNSDIRFSYWTTGSAVFSIHFRKDLWLAGHRHFLSFRRFGNSRNVEVPSRSRSTSTITALLRSTITFSLTPPTNHEHDHVSSSQLTPRASSLTPSLSVASLPFLTVACCLSPVAYSFTFKEGSSRRGYCGS